MIFSTSYPTDESESDQPVVQHQSIDADHDLQSTIVLEISRLDALDHLEAVLLLEQSGLVVADNASSRLQQRVDQLGRAMDAVASLCGLADDVDVTGTVKFTPAEITTLALGHTVAAYTYRAEGVPDTAALYEQRAVQLLESLAEAVVNET